LGALPYLRRNQRWHQHGISTAGPCFPGRKYSFIIPSLLLGDPAVLAPRRCDACSGFAAPDPAIVAARRASYRGFQLWRPFSFFDAAVAMHSISSCRGPMNKNAQPDWLRRK
jgi:hypothetical protein